MSQVFCVFLEKEYLLMDANQVYEKTPLGEESVRQSTRVVQRNLRMVLVQVDGKLTVAELSEKIGNPRMVEAALRDLEEGGFISPKQGEPAKVEVKPLARTTEKVSAISQFSTLGTPTEARGPNSEMSRIPEGPASKFSSFGKPILPASGRSGRVATSVPDQPAPARERTRREGASPLRWLPLVALGLVLAGVLLVLLYPYDKMKPAIEASASRLLQVPVHVGAVGVSFLPRPALNLTGVKLGDVDGASIETVRISSPLSLLGSGRHEISAIDVIGMSVPADFLLDLRILKTPPIAIDGHLEIGKLHFERLNVLARDVGVNDLSGDISFKKDGTIDKAAFENNTLGLRLTAMPVAEGIVLEISGAGYAPFGKTLSFDSLQAKAMLQKGKLVVQQVDTTFLNGILKGSWMLDWSKGGLVMAGDGNVVRLDCRKVSAALVPSLNLEGELAGSVRLRGSGKDWEGLWANIQANVDAEIMRGVFHGVDLGDTVRRGNGVTASGGVTKFDRLRVALNVTQDQVTGRDLQMSAGILSASGQFVAGRSRALDAGLNVSMQTTVATTRTPVRITGILPGLTAVSGK